MYNRYLTKAAPQSLILKRPDDLTLAMLQFQPANELEIKALNFESEVPAGYVAGWASTPSLDLYSHVVKTGAFDDSIKSRGLSGPKSIKLLLGHDWDKVTGVIRVLETRQDKLWIEAQLNLNISYARDAYEAMKMTGGFNFSVGFMLQDYAFKEDPQKNEYLQIDRGDLFEVSIVPFPGNEEATMDIVKSRLVKPKSLLLEHKDVHKDEDDTLVDLHCKTVAEFEKTLVASGLIKCRNDAKRVTHAVKQAVHLFRAEEAPSPPTVVEKKVEELVSETPTAPVLATAQLDELTSLVAKMRGILAPVAMK